MKHLCEFARLCGSDWALRIQRKGFTLIELLVVVLIIGILAAIAFPKYQTAVDKSRYTALMPLAKSLAASQESFYLAAGNYTRDLSNLELQLPGSPSGDSATLSDGTLVMLNSEGDYDYVKMKKNGMDNYYILYQGHSKNYKNEAHCEALADSSRANRLCVSLGGQEIPGNTTAGYKSYVLEGTGNGTPSEVPTAGACTVSSNSTCVRYTYMDGSAYEEYGGDQWSARRDYDAEGNLTHTYNNNGDLNPPDERDWYYENGQLVLWTRETANTHEEEHYENGTIVANVEYNAQGHDIRYWDRSDSDNMTLTDYWANGAVSGHTSVIVHTDGRLKGEGIYTSYDQSGAVISSQEQHLGNYSGPLYVYNSDGTYTKKPLQTQNDSSTWTTGSYTIGTNGDVTRDDGVIIPGSGNYQPLCTAHPEVA